MCERMNCTACSNLCGSIAEKPTDFLSVFRNIANLEQSPGIFRLMVQHAAVRHPLTRISARQMMLLCWFHPHTVTCLCPIGSGLQARIHHSLFDSRHMHRYIVTCLLPCFCDEYMYGRICAFCMFMCFLQSTWIGSLVIES